MSTASDTAPAAREARTARRPSEGRSWALSGTLCVLTWLSTSLVGAWAQGVDPLSEELRHLHERWQALRQGFGYSIPLMAILLCHEFGHYIAARLHRVPASPPFFVPLPLPPLGTMGAVILMPQRIASRAALLDIGAAGPIAGLCVALPVLAYGLSISPVQAIDPNTTYLVEGRSLLYAGLLAVLKGPIPAGHDVMLSDIAFAGWTGLFVTMLNLIPSGQLDGGHVAYALFAERQLPISRAMRWLLVPLGLLVAVGYGWPAFRAGLRGDALLGQCMPGFAWLLWFVLLRLMARRTGREHPPTDPGPLPKARRRLAVLTLCLFPLLFMPAWLRVSEPQAASGPVQLRQ